MKKKIVRKTLGKKTSSKKEVEKDITKIPGEETPVLSGEIETGKKEKKWGI